MSETLTATLPITRWQGDRGTYHLVTFTGDVAEALTTQAVLHKLEYGRARGFGSIKLTARIGDTEWRTSVFPQNKSSEWVLLISKKVLRAEDLGAGESVEVSLAL
ncbi:MAG: DUF1905 domain-containing protein [Erythrobacter sp.]|nr:DUF1905 domain-containing protein [Erythrobacter sp.]